MKTMREIIQLVEGLGASASATTLTEQKFWFNTRSGTLRPVANHNDDFVSHPDAYGVSREQFDAFENEFYADEDGEKFTAEYGDYLYDLPMKNGWVRVDADWDPGYSIIFAYNHLDARKTLRYLLKQGLIHRDVQIELRSAPDGATNYFKLVGDEIDKYANRGILPFSGRSSR